MQIILDSKEPAQVLDLFEQLFPGLKLDAVKKQIDGLDATGTDIHLKKLVGSSVVSLDLKVIDNAPVSKQI